MKHHVFSIPAPIFIGINSSRNPVFLGGLQTGWTPVFTCLREAASAKAGRGDG